MENQEGKWGCWGALFRKVGLLILTCLGLVILTFSVTALQHFLLGCGCGF